MVEKVIRGGICHSIHRHVRANNKYIKNYNENKDSSYIQYLDPNNLYGWAISQKLPVNGFKWVNNEMNEEFTKNYVVHIKSLTQALNHGLKLKKVHRIIEFHEEAWLKSYIDIYCHISYLFQNHFLLIFLIQYSLLN